MNKASSSGSSGNDPSTNSPAAAAEQNKEGAGEEHGLASQGVAVLEHFKAALGVAKESLKTGIEAILERVQGHPEELSQTQDAKVPSRASIATHEEKAPVDAEARPSSFTRVLPVDTKSTASDITAAKQAAANEPQPLQKSPGAVSGAKAEADESEKELVRALTGVNTSEIPPTATKGTSDLLPKKEPSEGSNIPEKQSTPSQVAEATSEGEVNMPSSSVTAAPAAAKYASTYGHPSAITEFGGENQPQASASEKEKKKVKNSKAESTSVATETKISTEAESSVEQERLPLYGQESSDAQKGGDLNTAKERKIGDAEKPKNSAVTDNQTSSQSSLISSTKDETAAQGVAESEGGKKRYEKKAFPGEQSEDAEAGEEPIRKGQKNKNETVES